MQIGICGSALEATHLPAHKAVTGDLPILACAVRREDDRALLCAYKQSSFAHGSLLSMFLVELYDRIKDRQFLAA